MKLICMYKSNYLHDSTNKLKETVLIRINLETKKISSNILYIFPNADIDRGATP